MIPQQELLKCHKFKVSGEDPVLGQSLNLSHLSIFGQELLRWNRVKASANKSFGHAHIVPFSAQIYNIIAAYEHIHKFR
jgi:hypothetical protein